MVGSESLKHYPRYMTLSMAQLVFTYHKGPITSRVSNQEAKAMSQAEERSVSLQRITADMRQRIWSPGSGMRVLLRDPRAKGIVPYD